MRLLLIGCTGFIGQALIPVLLEAGNELVVVSRKTSRELARKFNEKSIIGINVNPAIASNWEGGPLLESLKNSEGVINLVGEPIAERRWTEAQCKLIRDSRLTTTEALTQAMNVIPKAPKVLINASAIGYYGTSRDKSFNENNKAGSDFLATLCNEWENKALGKPKSTRLVILRIGITIDSGGGALGKMLPIFKAGLGGPIGSGEQCMSWIHRKDLCRMIKESLVNSSWKGVINAVAPENQSMGEFASKLGQCLGRPSLLKVPAPILKLLLGDGARVVLEGQNVESIKLKKLGFKFKYSKLKDALKASIS